MTGDSLLGKAECPRDRAVGLAGCDQRQHLDLACGQASGCLSVRPALEDLEPLDVWPRPQSLEDISRAVELDRGRLRIAERTAGETDQDPNAGDLVAIGGTVLLAAEILAGRRIGIRIEPDTLMMFDLDSRELLRVRPEPAELRQDHPAPRRPTRRTASPAVDRTRPHATTGLEQWRDHDLRPESPSAESTPTALSPSTSPRPRWPSSWPTATPASCDGPPPSPCVTSKPTGAPSGHRHEAQASRALQPGQ